LSFKILGEILNEKTRISDDFNHSFSLESKQNTTFTTFKKKHHKLSICPKLMNLNTKVGIDALKKLKITR